MQHTDRAKKRFTRDRKSSSRPHRRAVRATCRRFETSSSDRLLGSITTPRPPDGDRSIGTPRRDIRAIPNVDAQGPVLITRDIYCPSEGGSRSDRWPCHSRRVGLPGEAPRIAWKFGKSCPERAVTPYLPNERHPENIERPQGAEKR